MVGNRRNHSGDGVALLAEGVDRNRHIQLLDQIFEVALLAEGVDRNQDVGLKFYNEASRPPRGGRG